MKAASPLQIGMLASAEDLAKAVAILAGIEGVVVLNDELVLRPGVASILCEVTDPMPGAHRCAEEFKVMIENARRALAASRLGGHLPPKALVWSIVERREGEAFDLWRVP